MRRLWVSAGLESWVLLAAGEPGSLALLGMTIPGVLLRGCCEGVEMKVDIYRKVETSKAITGEFWVGGLKQCYYLEPSRLTPYYPGHPCIQAGIYHVVLSMSPHLGYVCPEVLHVPGRTAIRWHVGNFPKDVLGCCVVGTILGENSVLDSRTAFEALMGKLGGDVSAEYHEPVMGRQEPE